MYIGIKLNLKWFLATLGGFIVLAVGTAQFGSQWLSKQHIENNNSNERLIESLKKLADGGDVEAKNTLIKLEKIKNTSSSSAVEVR
ncbi:hypothetical protein [Chromobacterium vaccinii]|uniref:hypothetical protein n=1 Tax=Chromobacterium vaccinii TaxID=1108595 RepID=UPI0034590594